MKKTKNKILPFPRSQEPTRQTIICQIGSERFAIYIEVEDLPPVVAPLLLVKAPRRGKRIR